MIKSLKRMVLTGAAVMVMMSFAAPAMAADLIDYIDPNATYTDSGSSFGNSVYSAEWQQPVEVGPAPTQVPVEVGPAPHHVTPPCDPQYWLCSSKYICFWLCP
jgi:hypothetical protein